MTSAISAIGAIGSLSGVGSTTAASGAATSTSGTGFASELAKGIDAVSATQNKADSLAIQSATGANIDPAALTVAMTQATTMTQMATAVQSKAVEAFNQIMGMQA